MQQAADAREEAFQLMKLSRYLQKSSIAKLPAEQDQGTGAAVTAGLAKIDSNMIR